MALKLSSRHYIGIGISIALIIANFIFFLKSSVFYFFLGIAVVIGVLPFIFTIMLESGREKEKESMFLEFSRNLVQSVKSGTPISRSIINVKGKKYGSLSPYINKLANQISLGIPVRQAFHVFARDMNNKVITRSVALITEAEEAGGKIDDILENVAKNVNEVENVKKERKSSMYNTIVQLYIIFLVFLVIMVVLQVKFIPMMTKTLLSAGTPVTGGVMGLGVGIEPDQSTMNMIFIILIMTQGIFAGLVIGKLSEGTLKSGAKHSLIISALSYLITFGIKAFVSV